MRKKGLDFKRMVLKITAEIPRGETLTYREVAKKAGRPRAYRAVGNILKRNFVLRIPCHRVIRSDGRLGGYNRGIKEKERILREEGAMTKYKIKKSKCRMTRSSVEILNFQF